MAKNTEHGVSRKKVAVAVSNLSKDLNNYSAALTKLTNDVNKMKNDQVWLGSSAAKWYENVQKTIEVNQKLLTGLQGLNGALKGFEYK